LDQIGAQQESDAAQQRKEECSKKGRICKVTMYAQECKKIPIKTTEYKAK